MYDTIAMTITSAMMDGLIPFDEAHGIQWHTETGFIARNEPYARTGYLIGRNSHKLKFRATDNEIRLTEGSLQKWYMGSNTGNWRRGDVERAMRKLTDETNLPWDKAEVTRLDSGRNLYELKYPPQEYYSRLGECKRYERTTPRNGTLMYTNSEGTRQIYFYDKLKEFQKNIDKEPQEIRELFENSRGIIRVEMRITNKISSFYGEEVTGKTLYDKDFYMKNVDKLRKWYEDIQKRPNRIRLDIIPQNIKELEKLGLLCLLDTFGGASEYLHRLEAYRGKEVSSANLSKMKNKINEVYSNPPHGAAEPSKAIEELDEAIYQSLRFFS